MPLDNNEMKALENKLIELGDRNEKYHNMIKYWDRFNGHKLSLSEDNPYKSEREKLTKEQKKQLVNESNPRAIDELSHYYARTSEAVGFNKAKLPLEKAKAQAEALALQFKATPNEALLKANDDLFNAIQAYDAAAEAYKQAEAKIESENTPEAEAADKAFEVRKKARVVRNEAVAARDAARKAIDLPIDIMMADLNKILIDPEIPTIQKLIAIREKQGEIYQLRGLNILLLYPTADFNNPDPSYYAGAVGPAMDISFTKKGEAYFQMMVKITNKEGVIALQDASLFMEEQFSKYREELNEEKRKEQEVKRQDEADQLKEAEQLKKDEAERAKEAEKVKAQELVYEEELKKVEGIAKTLVEVGNRLLGKIENDLLSVADLNVRVKIFSDADAAYVKEEYERGYAYLAGKIEDINRRAADTRLNANAQDLHFRQDSIYDGNVASVLDAQIQKTQKLITYLENKLSRSKSPEGEQVSKQLIGVTVQLGRMLSTKQKLDIEVKKTVGVLNAVVVKEIIALHTELRTKELSNLALTKNIPPPSPKELKEAEMDLELTKSILKFIEEHVSKTLKLEEPETKELIDHIKALHIKQNQTRAFADSTMRSAFEKIHTDLIAYPLTEDLAIIRAEFATLDARIAIFNEVHTARRQVITLTRELAQFKKDALSKDMSTEEIELFISQYVQLEKVINEIKTGINNNNLLLNNNDSPLPLIKEEVTRESLRDEINKKYPKFTTDNADILSNKLNELSQTKQKLVEITIPATLGQALQDILSTLDKSPFDKVVISGRMQNSGPLLEALSNAQVKTIEFKEIDHYDLEQMLQVAKDKKITCEIQLPKPHNTSRLQFELDQLVSLNRREQTINPKEKPKQTAKETMSEAGMRIRDRIQLLTPSVAIEMQQESQQQAQVQVQVAIAQETDSDQQRKYPLPPQDDIIDRKQYLARQNNVIGDWDVWFGNIHLLRVPKDNSNYNALSVDRSTKVIDLNIEPDAGVNNPTGIAEFYENKRVNQLTKQALEQIEQHAVQFKYGVDLDNLPPGFILVAESNDANGEVPGFILHYDEALMLSNAGSRMTVNLADKPAPYVMSTFLFNAWLDTQNKLLEQFNFLASDESYNRDELDQLKIAILSDLSKEVPGQKNTNHHLIYRLVTDKQLTKDLIALKLNNAELSSLLAVLDSHGEEGLRSVVSFIKEAKDPQIISDIIKNHQSNGSFAFLLNDSARGQINAIMNLKPAERAWWNKLYEAHCATVGKDDFFALAQSFNAFISDMREYSALVGVNSLQFDPNPGFTDVKNMHVALSRMSALMHQCDPEAFATQWKELSRLDLQSNGAIRVLKEMKEQKAQFKLVTPEMKATPVDYAPNHDAGLGVALSGYTSLAVTNISDEWSESLIRIRSGYMISPSGFDVILASGNQADLERNYYRYADSAPISRSAQFYRNAAKQINDFKITGKLNSADVIFEFKKILYAFVASAHMGLDNVASQNEMEANQFIPSIIARFQEMEKGPLNLDIRTQLLQIALLAAPRIFKSLPPTQYVQVLGIMMDANEISLGDVSTESGRKAFEKRSQEVTSTYYLIGSLDTINGVVPFFKGLSAIGQQYEFKLIAAYATEANSISHSVGFSDETKRNLITLMGSFKMLNLEPRLFDGIFDALGEPSASQKVAVATVNEFMANKKLKEGYALNQEELFKDVLELKFSDTDSEEDIRDKVLNLMESKYQDRLEPTFLHFVLGKLEPLTAADRIAAEVALKYMANMQANKGYPLNKELFEDIFKSLKVSANDTPVLIEQKVLALMQSKYKDYFNKDFFKNLNNKELSQDIIDEVNKVFEKNAHDQIIVKRILSVFLEFSDADRLKPLITKIALLDNTLKQVSPDNYMLPILSKIITPGASLKELESLMEALSKEQNLNELTIFLDEGKGFKQEDLLLKANAFMTHGLSAIKEMQSKGISRAHSLTLVSKFVMAGFHSEADLKMLSRLSTDMLTTFAADKNQTINLLAQKARELNAREDLSASERKDQLAGFINNLHAIHKTLPPETFRSLITYEIDDMTSGAEDVDKLPQLLVVINSVFASKSDTIKKATTVSILGILSNLRNNKIPVSSEDRANLIAFCAENDNTIAMIESCYKTAPYPSVRQALAWYKKASNSADPAKNMSELYTAFSNAPCRREPENGFKMSAAIDQLPLINVTPGKALISNAELVLLEQAINQAKELTTEELRTKIKPPADLAPEVRVACLAELLHRAKGTKGKPGSSFELNTTQYIAAYLFAKGSEGQLNARITQQIDTGEGKSRVMMIACALEYSKGKTVDFVTSNSQLALRDYLEYKSFFSCIGAQTSFITAGSPTSDYHTEKGIHFSDVTNLSLFRNQAHSRNEGHKVLALEDKRALLLDEKDQTFFDSASTKFNYSMPTKNAYGDVTWIYPLMVKFALKEEYYDLLPEEYNKKCREFIAGELANQSSEDQTIRSAQMAKIPNSQLQTWQDAAFMAISRQYGIDYTIEPNVVTPTNSGPKLSSQVRLIQNNRTVNESKYSAGVHQCLHALLNMQLHGELDLDGPRDENGEPNSSSAQAKAAIKDCKRKAKGNEVQDFEVEAEKQIVYSTTSKNFVDDYAQGAILAVSGTIGADIERDEVTKLYGRMDYNILPRHNQLRREDKPMRITKNADARRKALVEDILEARSKNQPILIICKSDEETELLHELLKKRGVPSSVLLADASSEEESRVIAKGGSNAAVTISTGRMGRGTDIPLTDKEAKKMGLLTLIGHLPSLRDLLQFTGRSGRFGAEGETRVVCDLEQVKEFIGSDSIPLSLYTATDGLVQLQQLVHTRQNQGARIVQLALSDYQTQFTNIFFKQIEGVTNPETRATLLDNWADFIKNVEQNWTPHGAKIIAAFSKSQKLTPDIAKELVDFHKETEACWDELMKNIGPILGKTVRQLEASINAPSITYKSETSKGEMHTSTYASYDKALAGRATVFPTLFTEARAILNHERKFFANTRAALRGEGMLFADTIALLTGKRPLFANLRTWIQTNKAIARIDKEMARNEGLLKELMKVTPLDPTALKGALDNITGSLTEKIKRQSGTKKQETRESLAFWKAVRQVVYNEPLGESSATEEHKSSTPENPLFQLNQQKLESLFDTAEISTLRAIEVQNHTVNAEEAKRIRAVLESKTGETATIVRPTAETRVEEKLLIIIRTNVTAIQSLQNQGGRERELKSWGKTLTKNCVVLEKRYTQEIKPIYAKFQENAAQIKQLNQPGISTETKQKIAILSQQNAALQIQMGEYEIRMQLVREVGKTPMTSPATISKFNNDDALAQEISTIKKYLSGQDLTIQNEIGALYQAEALKLYEAYESRLRADASSTITRLRENKDPTKTAETEKKIKGIEMGVKQALNHAKRLTDFAPKEPRKELTLESQIKQKELEKTNLQSIKETSTALKDPNHKAVVDKIDARINQLDNELIQLKQQLANASPKAEKGQVSTISPQAAAQLAAADRIVEQVRAKALPRAVVIKLEIKALEARAQENALKYVTLYGQKNSIEENPSAIKPNELGRLTSSLPNDMEQLKQEETVIRKQIQQLEAELQLLKPRLDISPTVDDATIATEAELPIIVLPDLPTEQEVIADEDLPVYVLDNQEEGVAFADLPVVTLQTPFTDGMPNKSNATLEAVSAEQKKVTRESNTDFKKVLDQTVNDVSKPDNAPGNVTGPGKS